MEQPTKVELAINMKTAKALAGNQVARDMGDSVLAGIAVEAAAAYREIGSPAHWQ